MALLLAVTRPAAPLAHDLLIGVAVGFIGPIGIVLLYKGLGSRADERRCPGHRGGRFDRARRLGAPHRRATVHPRLGRGGGRAASPSC